MNKFLRPLVVLAVVGLPSYSLYSYWQQQQQSDDVTLSEGSGVSQSPQQNSVKEKSLPGISSSQVLAGSQAAKLKQNSSTPQRPTAGNSASPQQLEAVRKRYTQVVSNSRYPTLDARITALETIYPQQSFKPDEVVDLLAEPNAWQPASSSTQDLPLTPEQRNDGRKFIELKPERLLVMLPGDSLELPIEQLGANLQMKVDSREALPNGGFVLHGRLTNTDEVMRVTLTQTPGLSLAGIDTPKGHYVLQANDGQGWIASSDTLFKQEGRQTDMLLPPGS